MIEEVGLRADDLEAQAFFASASDMKRFDLAALDTLPHCLSRNSQQTHGLIHGEEVIWCFFSDTGAQVVCETNTPRGPGCQLFSGDDALVEPAMNCGPLARLTIRPRLTAGRSPISFVQRVRFLYSCVCRNLRGSL